MCDAAGCAACSFTAVWHRRHGCLALIGCYGSQRRPVARSDCLSAMAIIAGLVLLRQPCAYQLIGVRTAGLKRGRGAVMAPACNVRHRRAVAIHFV